MREASRRDFLIGAGAFGVSLAAAGVERLKSRKGEAAEPKDRIASPRPEKVAPVEHPLAPEEALFRMAAAHPEQFATTHGLTAALDYSGSGKKKFLAYAEDARRARFAGKDAEDQDQFFAHATPDTVKMIFRACEKYRVPAGVGLGLALAESRCKPDAKSSKGAVGVMQIMPETARALGLTVAQGRDERLDPEKCAYAGVRYLAELEAAFLQWDTALIAYNWGRGNLKNLIEKMRSENPKQPRTYLTMRDALPDEARDYVPRVEGYLRQWAQWMHARESATAEQ